MKIIVRDHKEDLIDELVRQWENPAEHPWSFDLDAKAADIFEPGVEADCFVSPANSFGWMDGGIDLVFVKKFGWQLEDRAKATAAKEPFGELVVGQAALVVTNDLGWPYMIMAPTMRTPRRNIPADAAFIATRAAVHCAIKYHFDSMLIPGMGTGTGGISAELCAAGMLSGIEAAIKLHEASTK